MGHEEVPGDPSHATAECAGRSGRMRGMDSIVLIDPGKGVSNHEGATISRLYGSGTTTGNQARKPMLIV